MATATGMATARAAMGLQLRQRQQRRNGGRTAVVNRRQRVCAATAGPDSEAMRAAIDDQDAPHMDYKRPKVEGEVDLYRDTLLRYAGYANECGEALSAFLPAGGVPFSYAIALTYVMADTVDKASKAYGWLDECTACEVAFKEGAPPPEGLTPGVSCETCPDHSAEMKVAYVAQDAVDALTWQLLASVFVPGSIIHLVVACVSRGLTGVESEIADAIANVSPSLVDQTDLILKTIPTTIGLLTIPLIVHPIDESIHKVLDVSVRPALRYIVGNVEDKVVREQEGRDVPKRASGDVGAIFSGAAILGGVLALPPTLFNVGDAIANGDLF